MKRGINHSLPKIGSFLSYPIYTFGLSANPSMVGWYVKTSSCVELLFNSAWRHISCSSRTHSHNHGNDRSQTSLDMMWPFDHFQKPSISIGIENCQSQEFSQFLESGRIMDLMFSCDFRSKPFEHRPSDWSSPAIDLQSFYLPYCHRKSTVHSATDPHSLKPLVG